MELMRRVGGRVVVVIWIATATVMTVLIVIETREVLTIVLGVFGMRTSSDRQIWRFTRAARVIVGGISGG